MSQRRRGNQANANGKDQAETGIDSAEGSSTIHSASSTATQKQYSSSSFASTTSSTSSVKGATIHTTSRATRNAVSGQKPTHSQTMLLELLLTVTRASLMILTPLVAGMTLRIAPGLLEPIYGSLFIKEHFLEYSLVSAGVGVVLAMIYINLSGSSKNSTSSSSSKAKSNQDTDIKSIGLRKDAKLRKGIIVSLDMCALFLASSFFTTHAMFKHSGEFGPWKGPHLTQLFLAYPVLGLLGFANTLACVLRSYEHVHVRTWMSCVLIQVGSILGLTLVVFQMAPQGPNCPRVYIAAVLVAFISGLHKTLPDERLKSSRGPKPATSHASLAMSFIPLVLVLAMAAQTATRNPQCQPSLTKAHNPPNGNYTILARNESITGWISVADELHKRDIGLHIRVMRAGHSLIGGMYAETGDSIFGSFYIPEAVRLIKNRDKSQQEVALQIGLGVGIASGSLTQLGVLVDVVEIDPVVADYASMYFDWPDPHQLFIQDGRQFIKDAPEGRYDYVIHDVFTGGGVPPSLFSLEALHEIQRIMKPDGVLAMNMVGSEHPSKAQALNSVRRTLHAAFKHVIAFKEDVDNPDGYQNMVFFAAQFPIEFDRYIPPSPPSKEEMQRLQEEGGHIDHALRPSVMRDWILGSFEGWPLSTPYDPSKGELILDRNNTLNAMQRAGAEEHWHAMRTLLPLDFWVNY
ncbi:hypothetical protein B0O80DRAFT_437373 [Mortierella sp. GBAus27b]|nr:hypothetical protein BGX31_004284 [Mortierella sp. GBA43]KAI8361354.1 hypothetical protein B0O80DRAFT_437373 [Mortierella sp. GBAus27b]